MSKFSIATNLFWGDDRYTQLNQFLGLSGSEKFLVIVDPGVHNSAGFDLLLDKLKTFTNSLIEVVVTSLAGEPTYDELDHFTNEVRGHSPDAIVAVGGGSTLDLSKGVSVLLRNPGSAITYRGFGKVSNAPVPVIAVPTTAGTGSEVTWTAAFIEASSRKKLGINGPNVAPMCGLLEPKLLQDSPVSVALSAGLDTLVHAVEAVTAKNQTHITSLLGCEAFAKMCHTLPAFLSGDRDERICNQMLLASYIAGIAMMNAGGGPASGISYPLGTYFGVPHGFAGGVFLSGVFKANVAKGYMGYGRLYDSIKGNNSLSENDKSDAFVNYFDDFYDEVNGPKSLNVWGCQGEADVNLLTSLTMESRRENLELNPVTFERTDVESLISSLVL